jgi:hypothetical protein
MNISQSLIRSLGSRYMPPNAIHFSELSAERQAAMLERAPILREKHFDWLFLKIPRTFTTWWVPFPPQKIRGNAQEVVWIAEDGSEYPYCKPIPEPGEWFENAGATEDIVGYHADTDSAGNINRSGARWDDVDGLMNWPSFRAGSVTNFFAELFK